MALKVEVTLLRKHKLLWWQNLVKDARKKANLTQEELAQKVHLKRPHISRIARAETDVRISTLQKIAQGLGGHLSISFDV